MDTVYTMRLSYYRPPLTANQRHHWTRRAKHVKALRTEARQLAEIHKIPHVGHCTVRLVWNVRDRRRRDADNLVPTLKALCDGLVDAGIVPDDTPEYMTKEMPAIVRRPDIDPVMWLEVAV